MANRSWNLPTCKQVQASQNNFDGTTRRRIDLWRVKVLSADLRGLATRSLMNKHPRLALTLAIVLLLLAGCTLPPSLRPSEATPNPRATATLGAASAVELITLPEAGAAWLLGRIEKAQTRVWVKIYLLTDNRIVDALKKAKNNGAVVRVLIEPAPYGAANIAREAKKQLRTAGLEIKDANPDFRLTHEKSFVIDDTAIILTANMTRSAFSRNREFAVITKEPGDVAEIANVFEADWSRTPASLASANLAWSPINSRSRITALVDSAQRTLDVYALSATDDALLDSLMTATKRGVVVRFVTSPGSQSDEGADGDTTGLDKLQRSGVLVRLVKSPFVHAKVFVADGATAFVGSVNISTASLDYNRELGLVFSDAQAIARLLRTFEVDWSKATER